MTGLDRITAGVLRLPGMVSVLLLASPLAMARAKTDWSAVQAVEAGRRMAIVLYSDEAPWGKRKIRGRFASATAESVTVLLPEGQSRTLDRRAVRRVSTIRPIRKRRAGRITAGVVAGTWQAFLGWVDQTDKRSGPSWLDCTVW